METQTNTGSLQPTPTITTPAMDIITPPKPQSVNAAVVEAPLESVTESPAESSVATTTETAVSQSQPVQKPVQLKAQKTARTVSMSTVVITLAAIFFVGLSILAYYAYSKNT